MEGYVFITGAAGGIGKSLLEKYASAGYNIVAQDYKESEGYKELIDYLKKKFGVDIIELYFDITDEAEAKKNIVSLHSNKIKVQHLINCAGIAHGGFFQLTPISTIKHIFDINLFGQMIVTQNVLKLMRGIDNCSIVNFCSITGYDLNAGNSGYGVSKAAMIAWTKMLSKELANQSIRVNGVAPGLTDTNMAKLMEDKAGKEMIHASLMNRLGRPEESASTVFFLTSRDASFINGEIIRIDGGAR